jgi:hypothetical protein
MDPGTPRRSQQDSKPGLPPTGDHQWDAHITGFKVVPVGMVGMVGNDVHVPEDMGFAGFVETARFFAESVDGCFMVNVVEENGATGRGIPKRVGGEGQKRIREICVVDEESVVIGLAN